jgi:tripartite-type tricarboxylate transporter receptor subunit TctC
MIEPSLSACEFAHTDKETPMFDRLLHGLGAALLALAAAAASAQAPYPAGRPVTIVVPFGAGSTTDVLARELAQRLAPRLGSPVVVENKPGAGGSIGAAGVAKSAPDGHTLLMGTIGVLSINEHLYPTLSYSVQRDFRPVARVADTANVLVVHPSLPVRTLPEFIAHARAHVGRLSYGTPGNGTSPHLAGELLKARAGISAVHIAYSGGPAALNDLVGGQTQFMFYHVTGAAPFLRDGRLRAIAIGAPRRDPLLPDVPTFAEAGLPDFDVTAWIGLMAPAQTPAAVVARIADEVQRILADPEVQARFRQLGADAAPSTPEAFAAHIARESAKWKGVIDRARIRLE